MEMQFAKCTNQELELETPNSQKGVAHKTRPTIFNMLGEQDTATTMETSNVRPRLRRGVIGNINSSLNDGCFNRWRVMGLAKTRGLQHAQEDRGTGRVTKPSPGELLTTAMPLGL